MPNRRQTVVINKPFQYQYALLIVSAVVLLTNIGLMAMRFYPASPVIITTKVALVISVLELALIAGVWWAGLKISHRIAGPVYVFTRELEKLAQGDLSARMNLRKKDQFMDAALLMNSSLDTLQKRIELIQSVAAQLNQDELDDERRRELMKKLEDSLAYFSDGD